MSIRIIRNHIYPCISYFVLDMVGSKDTVSAQLLNTSQ